MTRQQFRRGDKVRIADDLGASMRHFKAGVDVIVLGSYSDLYGGDDVDSYSVLFCDTGGTCSWYHAHQLTLLAHVGEPAIAAIVAEREAREKVESDLGWIVANWPSIRESPSGATMNALMARIGITEPWGAHGEGFVYDINMRNTHAALDGALSSGDMTTVVRACDDLKKFIDARKL